MDDEILGVSPEHATEVWSQLDQLRTLIRALPTSSDEPPLGGFEEAPIGEVTLIRYPDGIAVRAAGVVCDPLPDPVQATMLFDAAFNVRSVHLDDGRLNRPVAESSRTHVILSITGKAIQAFSNGGVDGV